ncbi:MAG TPA: polysaccharide biosynthesis/export family protein [Pyrinomonadaceae bacterium]|nr:polysaccharide biosynthesis/export family protein [Pyrinomonadaceae bacterium]
MKSQIGFKSLMLSLAFALACGAAAAARAQQDAVKPAPSAGQEKQKDEDKGAKKTQGPDERLEPDDTAETPQGVSEEALANRVEQQSEEAAAVLPYYNNFLSQYRLGPEDIISVSVFGQDRYSKSGIVVPPDGKISYYLIKGGIHVAGKTTEQVADEIAHHLDEFIIEPKVTVSLEKAQSMRYAVLGEVGQPGVRLMTRRLSVYEALLEAGGVLGTGNKKKVVLVRYGADRKLEPRVIDVSAIEKGRSPDDVFLAAGDQIFVPGNRMKTVNKVLELLPVISFARIFTGGW